MIRSGLPIDAVLPQIAEAFQGGRPLVVTAEPGAGKSTVAKVIQLRCGKRDSIPLFDWMKACIS